MLCRSSFSPPPPLEPPGSGAVARPNALVNRGPKTGRRRPGGAEAAPQQQRCVVELRRNYSSTKNIVATPSTSATPRRSRTKGPPGYGRSIWWELGPFTPNSILHSRQGQQGRWLNRFSAVFLQPQNWSILCLNHIVGQVVPVRGDALTPPPRGNDGTNNATRNESEARTRYRIRWSKCPLGRCTRHSRCLWR
jgi:hypothetical protein